MVVNIEEASIVLPSWVLNGGIEPFIHAVMFAVVVLYLVCYMGLAKLRRF